MPKPKKNLSLARRARVEIGTVIRPVDMYESLVITSEQIAQFQESLAMAMQAYEQFAERISGVIKMVVEQQLAIANVLMRVSESLSVFKQINVVMTNLSADTLVLSPHIFVQPNQPYSEPKALPLPQRKKHLSLAAVKVEGHGFALEGQYIKGMTVQSQTGRLFQLMLRQDLAGKIPDVLIGSALRVDATDYQAWGFVLRDLKEILAGNKLKLTINRYRANSAYNVTSLTKYIRTPKKKKRTVRTAKSN